MDNEKELKEPIPDGQEMPSPVDGKQRRKPSRRKKGIIALLFAGCLAAGLGFGGYRAFAVDGTISYNYNGGVLADGEVNASSYVANSPTPQTITLYKPTKVVSTGEGEDAKTTTYTFKGWKVSRSDVTMSEDMLSVSIPAGTSGNITLTATWRTDDTQTKIDATGDELKKTAKGWENVEIKSEGNFTYDANGDGVISAGDDNRGIGDIQIKSSDMRNLMVNDKTLLDNIGLLHKDDVNIKADIDDLKEQVDDVQVNISGVVNGMDNIEYNYTKTDAAGKTVGTLTFKPSSNHADKPDKTASSGD